jgi:hypothetical protein
MHSVFGLPKLRLELGLGLVGLEGNTFIMTITLVLVLVGVVAIFSSLILLLGQEWRSR